MRSAEVCGEWIVSENMVEGTLEKMFFLLFNFFLCLWALLVLEARWL